MPTVKQKITVHTLFTLITFVDAKIYSLGCAWQAAFTEILALSARDTLRFNSLSMYGLLIIDLYTLNRHL